MAQSFDVEMYGRTTLPAALAEIDLPRAPHQNRGGPLTESQVGQILRTIPSARRAARGVIISDPGGSFTHVFGLAALPDPDLADDELLYFSICSKREILRLRSIRTGHDYLLRLRANGITGSPRQMRVFGGRRLAWEAKGRVWSLTDYYASLNAPAKRYIARLARSPQRIVRRTPFGYAPMADANAACVRTLVGEVVAVSELLRDFYYFVVICLIGGDLDIDFRACMDAGLIATRIMVGSEAADFDIDSRGHLPQHVEAAVRREVDAMIEFTFGHEFSHHLLGHLGDMPEGTDARLYSHGQEYEADRHAVLTVVDRQAREMIAKGAYKVFFALELIRQIGQARQEVPRSAVSSSHPSPVERLWALHDALGARDAPRRRSLEIDLATVREQSDLLLARLGTLPPNTLTFYGSLYMTGLVDRVSRDRLEF
jgi:hypothetical protein